MSLLSRTAILLDTISGSSITHIALNHLFKKYGTITYISIDKLKQKISLSIILHGENDPIEIQIDKYTLIKQDYGTTFKVDELRSNRLWAHRLLNDTIVGNTLDVPSGKYSNILEELMFDTKIETELG